MMPVHSRRDFLQAAAAIGGGVLLQACGSNTAPSAISASRSVTTTASAFGRHQPTSGKPVLLRVIACSGYAERRERIDLGLQRLAAVGFQLDNAPAAYRRYQRFAGSDVERIADFQDVASGRAATPKVLMGLRGGYGGVRLLPHVDWASLGSRMREHGTLFFGFSDVCVPQLALLARGQMPSFAGPMVYSEFGKPQPSVYTMQSFIDGSTRPQHSLTVAEIQNRSVRAEGTFWGGNLSVLAALAGSPYLPDIAGGILFLEDVGEQPYRIERMLQTLYLAGILGRQQAVVLGNFRMGTVRDVYDSSYNLASVANTMSRLAKVPVLTGFPFGHIAHKATFPLGAQARIESVSSGGYQIHFSGYPTLDASSLALDSLLPSSEWLGHGAAALETSPEERSDLE